MKITEQLGLIQTKLKAPKSRRNTFGNYNYRSAEDILEAAKPVCRENGCTLTVSDDVVQVGDRYYIKAVATLANDQGEALTTQAFAREDESKKGMDASQISGTASSYARKYALNGLFCIDDTKDADATNTHGKKEEYVGNDDDPLGSKPICAYCAKPICDALYNGKKYTAKQIAALSQEKYGVPLHIECADSYRDIKEG